MDLSELVKFCHCTCNGMLICPFCQMLTVFCIILSSILLGYVLGRSKKEKSVPK